MSADLLGILDDGAMLHTVQQVHAQTLTSPARTMLLSLDLATTPNITGTDPPCSPAATSDLVTRLTSRFRTQDRLTLLNGLSILQACSVQKVTDIGVLADRFVAVVQDWNASAGRPQDTRVELWIAVGRGYESAAVLLARLDHDIRHSPDLHGRRSRTGTPENDHQTVNGTARCGMSADGSVSLLARTTRSG